MKYITIKRVFPAVIRLPFRFENPGQLVCIIFDEEGGGGILRYGEGFVSLDGKTLVIARHGHGVLNVFLDEITCIGPDALASRSALFMGAGRQDMDPAIAALLAEGVENESA